MNSTFIVDILRTPVGKYGGTLASIRPDDLAAHVIKKLVERNALVDPMDPHGCDSRGSAAGGLRARLRDGEGGRGKDQDRDVVPAIGCVVGESLLLEAADVVHRSELGRAFGDVRADRERRVATDVLDGDDERRRRGGAELDLRPDLPSRDDLVTDRDDRAVHGRVDVRPGDRADVQRVERASLELVPAVSGSSRSRDAVPEPCEEPFVRLGPDRLEHEGPVLAPVEADGRDAALRDRGVQAEVADRGQHVWVRRSRRDGQGRRAFR